MTAESGLAQVEGLAAEVRAARHGGRRRLVVRRVAGLEPELAGLLAAYLLESCSRAVTAVAGTGGPQATTHLDSLRRLLLRRCDGPVRRREVTAVIAALHIACEGRGLGPQADWSARQLIDLIDVEHALDHAARVGAAAP